MTYDIGEDKRLRRVHKTMKGYGWSLQYSVFVCDQDAMGLLALKTDLGELIHHGADSIAIVNLGAPEKRGNDCFEFMGVASRLPTTGPVII